MDLERYEIEQLDEFTYRFFSTGVKGNFEMRVRFTNTWQNTFNLGFGAIDPVSGVLDDLIELRNGDSQKILATVANVVLAFLELHPLVRIYATGSNKSRTRLYQMGINRVLPLLSDYAITGYTVENSIQVDVESTFPNRIGQWRPIRLGNDYDAFLIYKL